MNSPGNVDRYGAILIRLRPPDTRAPHSGVGSGTPNPRKESDAATVMALPIMVVAVTIIGDSPLGTTSENIILRLDMPIALAASTYSWPLTVSTDARVIRANTHIDGTATAIIRFLRLCPNTVTITMPSKIDGMDEMMSLARISRLSTRLRPSPQ